jgi:hypothetical protein
MGPFLGVLVAVVFLQQFFFLLATTTILLFKKKLHRSGVKLPNKRAQN